MLPISDGVSTRIPLAEFRLLNATLDDAVASAAAGRFHEGYLSLDLGLLWAETPPLDPRTGRAGDLEPWAPRLIALYRLLLVSYARRFGLTPADGVPLTPCERAAATAVESRHMLRLARYLRTEARLLRVSARAAREQSRRLREDRQALRG
jgi:hypothetical protein